MRAGTFFGYRCPKCGSTIDIAAIVSSDEFRCPNCGTPMVPDSKGKTSAANVYCPNCKAFFGLINSDRCPKCGGPFSKL